MQRNSILLLFFIIIWALCNFLGIFAAGTTAYLVDTPSDYQSYSEYIQAASTGKISSPYLQVFLLITHTFSFMIPALIISFILWNKNLFEELKLLNAPSLLNLILGTVLLITLVPMALYVNELLHGIQWPTWFPSNDEGTVLLMEELFKTRTVSTFLLNLSLIGIIAAIGEELLFRGVIQQYLVKIFKNGHYAIFITAFIFGLLHFQIDGLSVRIILGALLGYLFYYSKNLWLSIFIHLIYNSFQLILIYLNPDISISESVGEEMYAVDFFTALLIFLPGIVAFYYFRKLNYGQRNT